MTDPGYAGKVLKIDLTNRKAVETPLEHYATEFLGGRGIAAKLYWDEVPAQCSALDPDNALIFATGPMAGTPVLTGSRCLVSGKSPAISPEYFSCANLGGRWGYDLKAAGYDVLLVQGRSDKPVYLTIHDGRVEFHDATGLQELGTFKTRQALAGILGNGTNAVAIGPAGERMASMATILGDNGATASSGFGAVMGAKNLKAIALPRGRYKTRPARPEELSNLTRHILELGSQMMSVVGNMEFRITGPRTRKSPCFGCQGNCLRRSYRAAGGEEGKFMCQPATFYRAMSEAVYGPGLDPAFHAAQLCDDRGLDTMPLTMLILWLFRCWRAGILTEKETGIPISKIGSLEFMQTLVDKIAAREGFGDLMAHGVTAASQALGRGSWEEIAPHLSKSGQPCIADARLYLPTQLLHATEPRPPQPQLREISVVVTRWVAWLKQQQGSYVSTEVVRGIAQRFWGSLEAADFSHYEGKAMAAKMIQDRQYAKDCLVMCSFLWPIMDVVSTEDHAGRPDLESRLVSAVTGRNMDEAALNGLGERIFNLQRAILIREGYRGKEEDVLPEAWFNLPLKNDPTNPDCLVPGRDGEPLSRRGATVDRHGLECAKDEYYSLRGWDPDTGLPTVSSLAQLGLAEIGRGLAKGADM